MRVLTGQLFIILTILVMRGCFDLSFQDCMAAGALCADMLILAHLERHAKS